MNILRSIIFVYVLFFSAQAICQESIPALPIFKTICVAEKATGFNWRSGNWVQTNFIPKDKWLIQKINVPMNREKPLDVKYGDCTEEQRYNKGGLLFYSSCYSVKEFGRPSIPIIDNEMCFEFFENNKLKAIHCKNITFNPDGNFIMKPYGPSVDISDNPKDDYKDSLILSVGKCSKLQE